MKKFSLGKFVEAAVVGGVGISVFCQISKAQDMHGPINDLNIVKGKISYISEAANPVAIAVDGSCQERRNPGCFISILINLPPLPNLSILII